MRPTPQERRPPPKVRSPQLQPQSEAQADARMVPEAEATAPRSERCLESEAPHRLVGGDGRRSLEGSGGTVCPVWTGHAGEGQATQLRGVRTRKSDDPLPSLP